MPFQVCDTRSRPKSAKTCTEKKKKRESIRVQKNPPTQSLSFCMKVTAEGGAETEGNAVCVYLSACL